MKTASEPFSFFEMVGDVYRYRQENFLNKKCSNGTRPSGNDISCFFFFNVANEKKGYAPQGILGGMKIPFYDSTKNCVHVFGFSHSTSK